MNFMPVRQIEHAKAQRAVGQLALGFQREPDAPTRIKTFYQQGCLKARLPRSVVHGTCEAVLMNISGGVAGGDVLATSITLQPGAQVLVATQAAERIYRALNAVPAQITTSIRLEAGASLDYLPQETIFFDGFVLNRRMEIDLAPDAAFLAVESFVYGRQAMGEQVHEGRLRDAIRLRRNGVLQLAEMTRLDGDIAATLQRKSVGDGRMAMASLIYAAPNAAARLAPLRAALDGHMAGASIVEGILRARLLAPTAASLRNAVIAAIAVCRDGRALPRVWQG